MTIYNDHLWSFFNTIFTILFQYKKACLANTLIVLNFHYENTPIQIYRKFHLQKLKIFI